MSNQKVEVTKTGNSTQYLGTFDTKEEAYQYANGICQNFHPAGYGTTFTVSAEGDKFVAKGWRANSCE